MAGAPYYDSIGPDMPRPYGPTFSGTAHAGVNSSDIVGGSRQMGPTAGPTDAQIETKVRRMQYTLRKHGYNLPIDGKMGPLTRSALEDYHKGVNKRNPEAWNKAHNRGGKSGKGGGGGGGGKGGKGGGGGGGGGDEFGDLLAKLMKLTKKGGQVGEEIPMSLLDQLSNPAADEAIQKLYDQQRAALEANNAQSIADIQNWYGQVGSSFAASKEEAARIAAQTGAEMQAGTQGLIGSLGGGANPASAAVAGSGNVGAAMLAALGQAEQNYSSDMGPILQDEAAGASARQKALLTQSLSSLDSEYLAQMIGRSDSRTSDRLNLTMQIINANNNLAEQRYQNMLAGAQAGLAGLMSGVQIQGGQLDNMIKQWQLDNPDKQLGAPDPNAPGQKAFIPWAQLPPDQRVAAIQQAVSMALGPAGNPVAGPLVTYNRAVKALIQLGGWNNEQAKQMIKDFLRSNASRWTNGNPNSAWAHLPF